MAERHAGFSELMDHLAGRDSPRVAAHLARCPACEQRARQAERLLAAGRRAMSAPTLSRRARARALRIFRQSARSPSRAAKKKPSALKLVLDSLLRPAPAVRSAQAPAKRFLRYEGRVGVDLQIMREDGNRFELRGQLDPAGFTREVLATVNGKTYRAAVEEDGTFVLRGLPPGRADVRLGSAHIADLDLE